MDNKIKTTFKGILCLKAPCSGQRMSDYMKLKGIKVNQTRTHLTERMKLSDQFAEVSF